MSKCIGKIRHESREAANEHKNQLSHPNKLNSYQCDLCSGWHVGHKQQSRKQQNRKIENGEWFWGADT